MADEFRNPYHFVPLTAGAPPELVPKDELKRDVESCSHPHVTHDRYVGSTYSGRIVCRLEAESPLLVANEQEDNSESSARRGWTKLLKPFELEPGTPAIPASALRGMLSTLIEAASHSSLRVLTDEVLSHRVPMRESLSAIGRLVPESKGGTEVLRLQPLTVPTLKRNDRGRASWILPCEFHGMFQKGTQQPLVKAFVEGYRSRNPRSQGNTGGSRVETRPQTFLQRAVPTSFSADSKDYWYAKLGSAQLRNGVLQIDGKERTDSKTHRFLLGVELQAGPISEADYQNLSPSQREGYVRGILRVLGVEKREGDIPTQKKHELFIPLPEDFEGPTFEVTAALGRFHALADQRFKCGEDKFETALPYSPVGSKRNSEGDPKAPLRLRAGDLVFFRPDCKDNRVVAEVSISSVWRRGNETAYAYFPDALLPLGHGSRESLTLAEQLLGVVEERPDTGIKERDNKKTTFALAGRVRPSFGLLLEAPKEGAYVSVLNALPKTHKQALENMRSRARELEHLGKLRDYPLKNLSSPKPPSPAFYFTPKQHASKGDRGKGSPFYIAKTGLKPETHDPMGRKLYLRQRRQRERDLKSAFVAPAELEKLTNPQTRQAFARQHSSVEKVVRQGTVFHFHLDFDNLSKIELGLLCYALAPSEGFRHQLGHAKPFGFGCCRIDVSGLFLVNREQRYGADALSAPRYHSTWIADDVAQSPVAKCYPREFVACAWHGASESDTEDPCPEALARFYRDWAVEQGLAECLHALELLGTPVDDTIPVEYPQQQGASSDSEHFHWFVNNDDPQAQHQALEPIPLDADSIEPLRRNQPPPRGNPPVMGERPKRDRR